MAALLYALHFVHLSADFPAGTGWNDWSRYTDEGWYSDAAVRHFTQGHWYLPGEFNPAVAMPLWPLLLLPVFAVAGVSLVAARGLAVVVFGLALAGVWWLHREDARASPEPRFAGALAVFLLAANPLVYAFSREAVLEPLMTATAVWALVAAGRLRPPGQAGRWRAVAALGLLLPAAVLAKPTAVALLPAVAWAVWARAGYRLRGFLRLGWAPAALGAVLWGGYFLLWVPRTLDDFEYVFTANEYTSFQADPLWRVLSRFAAGSAWMGMALCLVFVGVLGWLVVVQPRLFRRPLVPVLLVWILGYSALLGFHDNFQARYYLPLAFPVTMLVALGLEALWIAGASHPGAAWRRGTAAALVGCVAAIAWPGLAEEARWTRHPAYTYLDAARHIAAIVRADRGHSPVVLSVSGSDLALMTGLPSVNTEFGILDLDQLVALYRPGWYVTWNAPDDEDLAGIAPLYRLQPVAAFPAMEDPDRDVLLLYRLEPRK